MSSSGLIRWSGLALGMGGICFAIFLLIHPFGELAGAEVPQRATWVPSHTFHFLGAMFTLFGLPGMYVRQMQEMGWPGLVGFALAFAGTAIFAGTGLITAYVWPVIADHEPDFVALDGPMFTHPFMVGVTAAPYVLMALGYVLLGVLTMRARILSRWGGLLLIIGIVMFSVPVEPLGPVPWIVRVVGAVVFGAGLAWLGYGLWASMKVGVRQPYTSPARR